MTNDKTQSDYMAQLSAVLHLIPQGSQSFAKSLLRNGQRYDLSDKQMFYVKKLVEDYRPKVEKENITPTPAPKIDNSYLLGHGTEKVLAMFALASQHLQKPKIRLYFGVTDTPDDPFSK